MSLQTLAKEFIGAFETQRYEDAAALLPKVKVELARAGLMVPSTASGVKPDDLVAARQVLEVGVLVAVHTRNEDEINRLVMQIRPFYSKSLGLPVSANMNKIMALYLLLLVAKNEIAELHTEIETLEEPEKDPFLSYPVRLERWLMEGSYDRVWKAITQQSQFPSPEFQILAESLVVTVRNEISLCSQQAYTSLPVANARHLLFLNSDQEILDFVANQPGWVIRDGRIYFPGVNDDMDTTSAVAESGPNTNMASETLVANTLDYAREIESII